MALQWYVVHAYSNYEHKVKSSLIERVRRAGLETGGAMHADLAHVRVVRDPEELRARVAVGVRVLALQQKLAEKAVTA